ncbi:hypothetical protein [Brasilonema bromeliae]|uniref:Uncharacterized protein n=1 Tax=Brasilonema bromeliae SPC951 TaxID=385972 RepID=A0ABX1P407_9CYAN|nr:hypothetical protein [Brasilonema bromeliae SPC951]
MISVRELALINDLKLAENAAICSENVVSEPFRQCLMHGFHLTLTSLIGKQLIYLVKFSQYLVLHKTKRKFIADITTKDSVSTNEEVNQQYN